MDKKKRLNNKIEYVMCTFIETSNLTLINRLNIRNKIDWFLNEEIKLIEDFWWMVKLPKSKMEMLKILIKIKRKWVQWNLGSCRHSSVEHEWVNIVVGNVEEVNLEVTMVNQAINYSCIRICMRLPSTLHTQNVRFHRMARKSLEDQNIRFDNAGSYTVSKKMYEKLTL